VESRLRNALLALSFYGDGGDWTSGKIAMRSPRTEPSQISLAPQIRIHIREKGGLRPGPA
jgi:hypothetical protein